jgi:hypothetical protein
VGIGWWIPSEIAVKDATKTIKYTSDEECTVSEKNMCKCVTKLHPENYKQKR